MKKGRTMAKKRKSVKGAAKFTHEDVAAVLKEAKVIRRDGRVFLVVAGEEIEVDREEIREAYQRKVMETGKTLVDLVRECYHAETDPGLKAEVADILAQLSEYPEVGGFHVKPDPARPN